MIMKIKAIIFDWGRTLFDVETNNLFPGAQEILEKLSKQYKLALVSLALAGPEKIKERQEFIRQNDLSKYFSEILMGEGDKDGMLEEILLRLNIPPEEIAVVDDRVIRGIRWWNKRGCTTVWLCKGKFSEELPDENSGIPTYTITDISQIQNIFLA